MIIKKTAFCSNKTCCPEISIDTKTNTVIITNDFDGSVKMDKSVFHSANWAAKELNEKRLVIAHSKQYAMSDHTFTISNQDGVYVISLEHQGQSVKGITLEQWNILASTLHSTNAEQWVEPNNVKIVDDSMFSFEKIDNGRFVILADKFGHAAKFSWFQLIQVRDFLHKLNDKFSVMDGKAWFLIEQDFCMTKESVLLRMENRFENDNEANDYFMLSHRDDYHNVIGHPNQGVDGYGFTIHEWLRFAREVGLYANIEKPSELN